MVKPVLCYGSQVWGYHYNTIIEVVHNYSADKKLHVRKTTNTCMVLGECGSLLLCKTYMTNYLRYWWKLPWMRQNRYPRQCYLSSKQPLQILDVQIQNVKSLLKQVQRFKLLIIMFVRETSRIFILWAQLKFAPFGSRDPSAISSEIDILYFRNDGNGRVVTIAMLGNRFLVLFFSFRTLDGRSWMCSTFSMAIFFYKYTSGN